MFIVLPLALLFLPAVDDINGLRCSVASVGDVDGDDVPDFVLARRSTGPLGFGVPDPDAGWGPGVVWILSGRDGRLLRTLEPPGGDNEFGRTLADLGDLDGDGQRELAVAGTRTWILSGADGSVLHELPQGLPSGGGDLDGDEVPDIAIADESGRAFVYSGRDAELLLTLEKAPKEETAADESTPTASARVRLPGPVGSPLAFVPDRDGDGKDEVALVAGAKLLLVDAAADAIVWGLELPEGDENVPWITCALGDLDGDGSSEVGLSMLHDFVLVVSGASGEELRRHSYVGGYLQAEGSSLGPAGDLDGDGVPDYLIGANEDGMDCDPGFALVLSGADGTRIHGLQFDYDEDGQCGPGADACSLGDVDGDGLPEVVVHIPRLRETRILSGADFSALVRIDLRAAPFTGR